MSEPSKEAVAADAVSKLNPSNDGERVTQFNIVLAAIDAATAPLREEIEKMTAWNKLTSLEITNLRSLYEEETSDLRARIRELEGPDNSVQQ
jgi:hypothetical protein